MRIAGLKALATNKEFLGTDTIALAVRQDPEGPVREAACEAAGELGDITIVPVLIPKLHEGSFSIRNAAHKALRKLTGEDYGIENEGAWQGWWEKHH